jgi:hypothetical protein
MAAGAHASPESLVQSFRWAEKTLEGVRVPNFKVGRFWVATMSGPHFYSERGGDETNNVSDATGDKV